MIYLLEKVGKYKDYDIKIRSNKDSEKYFAVFDESSEIDVWLLEMNLGRKPFDDSHTFNFKTSGMEQDIRQLDFVANGTTFNLVSAAVSHFFKENFPDSVRFFNTSIKTVDGVLTDYKIMIFTVWDRHLYDQKASSFSEGKNFRYLQFPVYLKNCLQGRPIVVNADCSTHVLISAEVAEQLKAQKFNLLGLSIAPEVE